MLIKIKTLIFLSIKKYCFKKELSQIHDLFLVTHQLYEISKDYCLRFSDEKTEWLSLSDVSQVVYLNGRKNQNSIQVTLETGILMQIYQT